jgi:hypothetical protein
MSEIEAVGHSLRGQPAVLGPQAVNAIDSAVTSASRLKGRRVPESVSKVSSDEAVAC